MEEQIRDYREILKSNPTDVPAFTALEEIYTGTDRWAELVDLYENRFRFLDNPSDHLPYLEKCALVWQNKAGDLTKALLYFRRILDIDPENRFALTGMEEIYTKRADWSKLVEVLERLSGITKNTKQRAEIFNRMGELYLNKLKRRDRAMVAWRHALSNDPGREDVLESLSLMYRDMGYYQRALELLQQQDKEAKLPADALGYKYLELGQELLEEPLFEDICKVCLDRAKGLLADPSAAEKLLVVLDEYKRDWEKRVKRLRLEAVESPDKNRAVRLYRRVAEIYFLQGGYENQVKENLNKCLLMQPGNTRVLDLLQRFYLEKNLPDELLARMQEMIERSRDTKTSVMLLERMAMLATVYLNDKKTACTAYRRIVETDPDHPTALISLMEYHQEQGQWAELVKLLRVQAERESDSLERAQALLKVARITEEKLKDPQAAKFVYQEVFRISSDNLQAALSLAKIYRKSQEWDGLVGCLDVQLMHARDDKTRGNLLQEQLEIHKVHRGDSVSAFKTAIALFSLEPEKSGILQDVLDLGKQTGYYRELADVLKTLVGMGGLKKKRLLELMEILASIYLDNLDSRQEALKVYQKILDQDPKNMTALDALEKLQAASGGSLELVSIYRQQVKAVRDKQKKKELLFKLADIYDNRMADSNQAIGVYREILSLDEKDVDALEKTAELYEREGHWQEAVRAWEESLNATSEPMRQAKTKYRLASIYEHRLNNTEKALILCNQILSVDQIDPQTAEGAVRVLERLRGRNVSQVRVAEILQPYYALAGEWRRHIEMLEIRLEACEAVKERVELLERIAQVYEEQLEQKELAFSAYGRAFVEIPEQASLKDVLIKLAEQTGQQEMLSGFFEQAVRNTEDKQLRISLNSYLGELYQEKLNRPLQAIRSYRRMVEDDPTHGQALHNLAKLLRAAGQWEEYVGVVKALLDMETEQQTKKSWLQELVWATESGLHDRPQAIEILTQSLAVMGDDLDMLGRLDELLEKEGRFAELAEVLEREIALSSEEQATELRLRLGRVRAERAEDRQHAVDHYKQLLVDHPDDARAVQALESLLGRPESAAYAAETLLPVYEKKNDWPRLVRTLEVRAELLNDPLEKVQCLRRAAESYENRLQQPDRAFSVLRRAFFVDSSDPGLLESLEKLAEKIGAYEQLAAVLEDAVSTQQQAQQRVGLLEKLAQLYAKRLQRADLASASLRRLLDVDPKHTEALLWLEELYRDAGALQDLAWVLGRKVDIVEDQEKKRDLLFEAAQIQEQQLNNLNGAVSMYEKIFSAEPDNLQVAKQLDRLYGLTKRWKDQVELLPRLAKLSKNVLGVIDYNSRLAELLSNTLDQPRKAIEVYAEVLKLKPNHPETIASLEKLLRDERCRQPVAELLESVYRSLSEWRKLAAVLELRLSAVVDSKQRMKFITQLMEIYENRINEKHLAFQMATRAFKEEPEDEGIQKDMQRLAENADLLDELVAVYLEVADRHPSSDLAVKLRKNIARIHERDRTKRKDAIEQWERLLETDASDREVLHALERLYREEGDFNSLVRIYKKQAEITSDLDQKKDILFRTAACLSEGIEDIDGAVLVYDEILMLDPADRRALKLMDNLFTERERWSDLEKIIKKQIELVQRQPVEDGSEKIVQELSMRLANLKLHKIGDSDGGIAVLQDMLRDTTDKAEIVPVLEGLLVEEKTRQKAAEMLEPIYRELEEHKKLVAILEVRLPTLRRPDKRMQVYRNLMEIMEEHLKQPRPALKVALRAFGEVPEDESLRLDLERLAQHTGLYKELAKAYEEAMTKVADAEVSARLRRRLAQLKEGQLGEKNEAVSHWRQVLAADPEDHEALKALERLYREHESYSELVGVLRNMAELEQDTEKKKDLYQEAAEIMEERLGHNDGAIETYREMLALDPGDLATLKLLDRLLQKENRWEDLKEVLLALVDRAGSSELVSLEFRLAELSRSHLGQPEDAVGYYASVLRREPSHAQSIQALTDMFDRGESRQAVAPLLVKPLEVSEDWSRLVAVLAVIEQSVSHPRDKKTALVQMADVYVLHLSKPEAALQSLGKAYQVDPKDEDLRLKLEKMAEVASDYQALASIYNTSLDGISDKKVLLTLRRRLANLYTDRLEDPQKALLQLRAVVAIDPKDLVTLKYLEDWYRSRSDYRSLVEILQLRIKAHDNPEEILTLLFEVAALNEQHMEDMVAALAAYQEILEFDPHNLDALRSLKRLYQQQGRMKDLAQVMISEINTLDQTGPLEEALDMRFQLAQLYDQEFADSKRAMAVYRDILQADPTHQTTLEYLQGMLSQGGSIEGTTELLEEAYAKTEDWRKYIDVLETQVTQSRVMTRRVELLSKIADVQENRLGLKMLAFNTYVRIFNEDFSNQTVRVELERIAREDENYEGLSAVYEGALDNIDDPVLGVPISLKLAHMYENEIREEEEAIRFYNQTLGFEPNNRQALEALDGLYDKNERHEDLAGTLIREIELTEQPSLLVDLLYRLGKVNHENLDQTSQSIEFFQRVLEIKPDHLPSLHSLERAFTELGDHPSLYEILAIQLRLVEEPAEKVELVARMADLASQQLGRPDEAIDLWRKILEEQEAFRHDAFESLDRLYEKTERWAELAKLIDAWMKQTTDPEEIASLSSRLGWVKGEKLGQYEDAIEHWQEVLRLDPKSITALESLRNIYVASGQWEQLVSVLRRLVPLQEDMLGVKRIRFELAEILGEKLARHTESIEAAKRVLDIEPHSVEELGRLSSVFRANEAWQDAVAVLEQSVVLRESEGDKIETLFEVASIWREKIGRPLGAAVSYEKILELEPFNEEAYRSADVIYRENKEWRRLNALLEKRLLHIRERKDRVELIKEVAEIYEQRLGQKELAFARYCAAFREDFSDDALLRKLVELAEETEDHETLLEVLEDASEEVTLGPRAVDLHTKIANIHLRMNQVEKAEERLKIACDLDKRDVASLEALAQLYKQHERWNELVAVYEKKYERSDSIEQRKDMLTLMADLQENKLGKTDQSVESYRRIMELDGRDAGAIQALVRLYSEQERWYELIQILRKAVNLTEDIQERVLHLSNIAGIWEAELDNDDMAIDTYLEVLELDKGHDDSLRALSRIYTRLDRWSELLKLFEDKVELVKEEGEKIKLYYKMGSIWEERFGNVQKAIVCHDNILTSDPNNLQSVKALERLVRRTGDFNRLIDLYEKHLELVEDQTEIMDIHLSIADVWYRELSRVDRAEEVYNKAMQISPNSRQAIHALGKLYEKSGNWFNAIEMLQKEAEIYGASADAVDLYYRMGKISEDMLQDASAARESYTKALTIDPTYLPAIKALKLIHYMDKDYENYLVMMVQEAENTDDAEDKTQLYYELGKFHQEHYEDSTKAATYYEEALRKTPDFLPAAKPLADIYFRTEQWEAAEKIMEIVVQGLDRNTESKELCRQYYRLGYITEKIGKPEKALEHYRMSYELDATYLPVLEGLGQALLRARQWEEAYRIFQTILIHHRDSLSDAEVAELYWQIGDVQYRMEQMDRAMASFHKALELDGSHLGSLQYLLQIHEDQEKWEEAYDYGMQMVDAMDEEELFEHYLRMGALCKEKLQDPFRALDIMQSALKLKPESLYVMEMLLDDFIETRQYQRAVEMIEQIVQVEKRPPRLVARHEQAGQLLRDELNDTGRAVEHFNALLDVDPSQVSAFQSICEILSAEKDWMSLRDSYIAMIKRLPAEAKKMKLALWKDMGELCRVALRNIQDALEAYRMVVALDPADVNAQAILADLLSEIPSSEDEAIEQQHKLISMSADRIKSYRVLWKLYNKRKEYDKVYSLALVLNCLKKTDDEEKKIISYFSSKAPQQLARPLQDEIWESVLAHPDVKVPFTKIFRLLYLKAPSMFLKSHKDLGLRRKEHAVDFSRDKSLFAHTFDIAAKSLGGMEVELFALKDREAQRGPGLNIALAKPTAVVAYRTVFKLDRKKTLLFHIARHLSFCRPEFILAYALPIGDLNTLLQAACLLANPNHEVLGEAKGVEEVRKDMERSISDASMKLVKSSVAEYMSQPRSYSLRRWIEAVEHTANRVGFVICNDLSTGIGILRKEQPWLTPMRSIQKVRELIVYASSPTYLKLRQMVGLAVRD